MSVVGEGTQAGRCVHHPKRETVLRCGKCGDFICTRCSVQTPVGYRCRECAQLRRLPQFDVGLLLLARSGVAGLVASLVVWWVVSLAPYLRFFLSILVGVAVGEVMSRLARRRSSRALEVVAVADVVVGLLVVEAVRLQHAFVASLQSNDGSIFIALALPMLIASFVAVTKLR